MTYSAVKEKLLPWLAYPSVMYLVLMLQQIMLKQDLNIPISSYVPIFFGITLISLLEWIIPYRKEWRPPIKEVSTDVIFTVLVQIILPKVLTLLVALTLLDFFQNQNTSLQLVWPHQWPLLLQVVLMLMTAEFMRYWIHRLAHNWSPLWRLHAVHHSPDKLYWLNTSRFHPLEKMIQFLFDSLPFIVLGVSAEVLSIYFVFYAINGFFQHSNINLKMGILNYVISSAQMHRWHHSKIIDESGTNYGNNLIIWDLVFGSWFLPNNREVTELGLINRSYPMSFTAQMKSPFTPGIDKHKTRLLGITDIFTNFITRLGIMIANILYKKPFERSLLNPMKYQHKLLRTIINDNKQTDYGKENNFNNIKSYADFKAQIPIQDYEALRPFIEKQEQNKTTSLTYEQPRFYAATSGTTGKPKHIPVLMDTIKQHQKALAIFACAQTKLTKHIFCGKLLAIPGAYQEGNLPGNSVYGSISGLLYYLMPSYLRKKYVVPNEVFGLLDHNLKYRLIIRLAIQYSDISYMVSANPSTFIKLMEVINQDFDTFVNDVQEGTFSDLQDLPIDVVNVIKPILKADAARSKELRELNTNSPITYKHIWPNLKQVVTWAGGSCGVIMDRLQKMLSPSTDIVELGYLASELRATITLEDTGNSGVPTIHDNFYEFIETTNYTQNITSTVTLNQLEPGKQYYVIITTSAGLYRYFMNDIVEVTGFKHKTPLLRFIQKGKGVTNITGEKLSEYQLMTAITAVNKELDINSQFYISLTSLNYQCYELYFETDDITFDSNHYGLLLDDQLRQINTEYASKRSSDRLKSIRVYPVTTGTGNKFKEHEVAKGIRENQFKSPLLLHETDCDFDFKEYVL